MPIALPSLTYLLQALFLPSPRHPAHCSVHSFIAESLPQKEHLLKFTSTKPFFTQRLLLPGPRKNPKDASTAACLRSGLLPTTSLNCLQKIPAHRTIYSRVLYWRPNTCKGQVPHYRDNGFNGQY